MAAVTPGQTLNPVAKRSIAKSYGDILALAAEGEKAGVEKDPQFQELLKVLRIRALADSYRRLLDEKYSHPSAEDIEAYYKQNAGKYERMAIDRVFIPKVNVKLPKDKRADFEKKAQQIATEIHERATKGEDVNKLQVEAYKTLGLIPPATTDLGARNRGSFPITIEQAVANLKTGEVSKIISDPTGFTFYKMRSRDILPLDAVKDEIVRTMSEKNKQAAIQSVLQNVHTDLNEQFFATPVVSPPRTFPPRPTPGPAGAPGMVSPAPAGGNKPAATPAKPQQQPPSPK
jgi:hypothetical protein